MLIDGVEITSPDSRDSIYYGPLDSFEVLNGGRDYNVQFPPSISIISGVGNTAYVPGLKTSICWSFELLKVALKKF